MRAKVSKWGNSLALRLPKQLVTSQSLSEGSEVDVRETPDGILIKVAQATYDLEDLLGGVSPENQHRPVETGPARGKEAW